MSNPPWMPLHIKDYLADTGHLTTAQHGAYLLLIMHYWQTGGLPDDDAALATITKTRRDTWRQLRPVIRQLFGECWRHKRIDRELQHAAKLMEKRSERAKEAALKRWAKNAPSMLRAMRQACP